MRLKSIFIGICGFLLADGWMACAKRSTGEINVDETQGCVNKIEKNFRDMRSALRAKDLSKAQDMYGEALELYKDNKSSLANYPELGELKIAFQDADVALCHGLVNIGMERFFEAVRAKDAAEARSRLQKTQQDFESCKEKIKKHDDFVALQMNLQSAPQALVELDRELRRPELLAKIRAIRQDLTPRLQSLKDRMVAYEKQPAQKELAKALDSEISALKAQIQGIKEFGDDAEWLSFASAAVGELGEMEAKRILLVRRGKVMWVVLELLPQAANSAKQASGIRKVEQAREAMQQVLQAYKECEELVSSVLKEEPELAKYVFVMQGNKRSPPWLKKHCASEKNRTEALIQRLGGKLIPVDPPEVDSGEDATASEQPQTTSDQPQKSPPKKPKRRPRRW